MKNILSLLASMLLVSALALTGFAVQQKDKKTVGKDKKTDGTSNIAKPPDKDDPGPGGVPDPAPEDSYEYIKLNCWLQVASVKWRTNVLYESDVWSFRTYAVNNTGKAIPASEKIVYFLKGTKGDFKTSTGFFPTTQVTVPLVSSFPKNGTFYLGWAEFHTRENPAQVTCEAYHKKKKK